LRALTIRRPLHPLSASGSNCPRIAERSVSSVGTVNFVNTDPAFFNNLLGIAGLLLPMRVALTGDASARQELVDHRKQKQQRNTGELHEQQRELNCDESEVIHEHLLLSVSSMRRGGALASS
jgi:hypothetical protein